jgi:soluble lytic murein transglycosylase-like protein
MIRFFWSPNLLYCLLLMMGTPLHADVYKMIGRNGQVIFTDKPEGSGYHLVIKSNRPAPSAAAPSAVPLSRPRGPSGDIILGNGPRPVAVPDIRAARPQRGGRQLQYARLVERAAEAHGLDPWLLHAVIQAESSYNPQAVSHKGAKGLMQLMPGTAERYGVRDPYDPEDNVFGGARYLRDLMGMFGSDVRLAVAAYNAGEGNVMKYGNQVPPFSETQGYVSKVLGFYRRSN